MIMNQLYIARKREKFLRDPSRVIAKFYFPGIKRSRKIISRILKLSETEVQDLLTLILRDFRMRHNDIQKTYLKHFSGVKHLIPKAKHVSKRMQLLIGSFFTHEYSIEAAGLFNPSIIPHPVEPDSNESELKFILSLRGTGEGHISSLVFRSGSINLKNRIKLDPVSPYVEIPDIKFIHLFDKKTFLSKLDELKINKTTIEPIFSELPEKFVYKDLKLKIKEIKKVDSSIQMKNTIQIINWIIESNYSVTFRENSEISERVLYPVAREEIRGIEDARFVRFIYDDNEIINYATYTGYNGNTICPMLLETKDFVTFKMCTLNGKMSHNKNMALFPRKVNGCYTMISRQDGENLYIMQSEFLHFWETAKKLASPKYPWELIQIGNCGSPIETEKGWLLLIHGVGAMRKYSVGAMLLDLGDPSKIIGRLKEPLISPNENEREGYVPNVVYTCGAMLNNETLIIPYASSDTATGFVTVEIKKLLEQLLNS